MSSQDKKEVIEHIIYPYTPLTKDIFLKEVYANEQDVFLNGKKVATQQVSKKLREFLVKHNFTIAPTPKKHLEGRKKIYGIPISVSKNYQGTTIKELLITIYAETQEELIEKRKIIISGVKSVTNVSCKYATSDKFVRC